MVRVHHVPMDHAQDSDHETACTGNGVGNDIMRLEMVIVCCCCRRIRKCRRNESGREGEETGEEEERVGEEFYGGGQCCRCMGLFVHCDFSVGLVWLYFGQKMVVVVVFELWLLLYLRVGVWV